MIVDVIPQDKSRVRKIPGRVRTPRTGIIGRGGHGRTSHALSKRSVLDEDIQILPLNLFSGLDGDIRIGLERRLQIL
jgi:hypothetical protein